MATSTFKRQFRVQPDKAEEFVKEMTKTVSPTRNKGFSSHLAHVTSDNKLRESLIQALNK